MAGLNPRVLAADRRADPYGEFAPLHRMRVGTTPLLPRSPYTFPAKRYTFPYTRPRRIERGTQGRDEDIGYGNGYGNGYEGQSGQPGGAGDSPRLAPDPRVLA